MEGVSLRPFSFLSELHPPCHGRGLGPDMVKIWRRKPTIKREDPLILGWFRGVLPIFWDGSEVET